MPRAVVARRIGFGFELPIENGIVGPHRPKITVGANGEVAVRC